MIKLHQPYEKPPTDLKPHSIIPKRYRKDSCVTEVIAAVTDLLAFHVAPLKTGTRCEISRSQFLSSNQLWWVKTAITQG